MNCHQLNDIFDDYIDGLRPDAEQHVAACSDCQQRVAREQRLRRALADYASTGVPEPGPAFFERALATAVRARNTRHHNRGWLKGFGSAVAAGLLIWFVAADRMAPREAPGDTMPRVTMALEDTRTIKLVFSSAVDLNNATLTVSLPPGIELYGFRGQREISWVTSLREGKNVLPLRLIALSPQGGELMATLRHDDDDRTFRLQVTVTNGAS